MSLSCPRVEKRNNKKPVHVGMMIMTLSYAYVYNKSIFNLLCNKRETEDQIKGGQIIFRNNLR